jgi:hypothetical protein
MTSEELAASLVSAASERLRQQYANDILSSPDLTTAGDEARRVTAIKARVLEEIAIQIQMEINRHDR